LFTELVEISACVFVVQPVVIFYFSSSSILVSGGFQVDPAQFIGEAFSAYDRMVAASKNGSWPV